MNNLGKVIKSENLKFKCFFLLNLSLCFLIGCKSIPMSTEKTPNLLVGEIVFVVSDYVSSQGISFNGKTTSGIEITIRNIATNEILRFAADKNGLFYADLQEGKYWINELSIKKQHYDGSWAYISAGSAQPKVFEVERGKVNNIGTIQWSIDKRNNVIQMDNSSDIKNKFSKQFPESIWNTKEWIYNPCKFN